MSFINPKRRNSAPTFLSPLEVNPLKKSNITKFLISAMYTNEFPNQ